MGRDNFKGKTMKLPAAILILIALVGCATQSSGNANWREKGYNRQGQAIAELVESKQITRLEGLQRMMPVVRTYFPEDYLLLGVWTDLIQYAEQVERGELTNQKYRELFDARWALFEDANKHRQIELDAIQSKERQGQFVGNFLLNMSRSLQRSNPQPINCETTSMPGVLNTSCR